VDVPAAAPLQVCVPHGCAFFPKGVLLAGRNESTRQRREQSTRMKFVSRADSGRCGKTAPFSRWRRGGRADLEVEVGDGVDLLSPALQGGDLGAGRPGAAPHAAEEQRRHGRLIDRRGPAGAVPPEIRRRRGVSGRSQGMPGALLEVASGRALVR
jgi:hypothetical protein